MDAAAATEVLQVQGGDTVEFVFVGAAISPDKWDDKRVVQWECPDGRGACNNVDTSRVRSLFFFSKFRLCFFGLVKGDWRL
jgi:hypothetical protein